VAFPMGFQGRRVVVARIGGRFWKAILRLLSGNSAFPCADCGRLAARRGPISRSEMTPSRIGQTVSAQLRQTRRLRQCVRISPVGWQRTWDAAPSVFLVPRPAAFTFAGCLAVSRPRDLSDQRSPGGTGDLRSNSLGRSGDRPRTRGDRPRTSQT